MESPLRILHLEDNADDAELVRMALTAEGLSYDITHVATRKKYLSALQTGKYDIVLGDYDLPGYDGLAALKDALNHLPNTPFIFVSGFLGEEKAIEALKQGATDYVLKDKLSRLAPSMRRALREAEERRQRRQAEAALVRKVAELERSNVEFRQCTLVGSDHLRRPLDEIVTQAIELNELLEGKLDEQSDKLLDDIVDNAGKIQKMLLAVNRKVKIGEQDPYPEEVALEKVLSDVILEYDNAIRELDAMVEFDTMPSLRANRFLLHELFVNLIDNALKFRTDTPPHIQINVRKQEGYYLFSVADNGIGVASQDANRIFEMFERVHSGRYPGVGSGLAICKQIVTLYRGKIWVASHSGQGATFYFSLPATKPANAA